MIKTLVSLIVAVSLSFSITAKAQDISMIDLLKKVDHAVSKLDEYQFTLHDKYSKFVTDDDSSHNKHTTVCYFKKNSSDTLMGYQLASFREDGYQQIYDGSYLFTVYDKTLEVTPRQEYASKIKEQLEGYNPPTYIITTNGDLQRFNQPSTVQYIRLVGLDYSLGEKCYKLHVHNSQDPKSTSDVFYYVSANSFLPLKTVTTITSFIKSIKTTLIFDYSITNIKQSISEANPFSREKLSDYRVEKNYDPSEEDARNELLPISSIAPDWKLPLIAGNTLNLKDLKGKIVIMDFWFKACAPCQEQMISLQALHEKFPQSEVVFIGINTIDNPQRDRLELFLKNRHITMPSVYNGKTIESRYKVYGSPALFIIDKQGVIIYKAGGYSSTLANEVDQVVVKQLK